MESLVLTDMTSKLRLRLKNNASRSRKALSHSQEDENQQELSPHLETGASSLRKRSEPRQHLSRQSTTGSARSGNVGPSKTDENMERKTKTKNKELQDFWQYEKNNGGTSEEYLDYILKKSDGIHKVDYRLEHVVNQRMNEGPYHMEKYEFLRQRKCMEAFLSTIQGDEGLRKQFEKNCLKENGKLSWWVDVQDCPFILLLHESVRMHFIEFLKARQSKVMPKATPNKRQSLPVAVTPPEHRDDALRKSVPAYPPATYINQW